MTGLSWGRRDAVRIVITIIGADGEKQRWFGDVRAGRDKAETIKLPESAQAVSIERPVRVRVELGRHRARRWTSQPARPSWRDDSDLFLWWRSWRAEREARRTVRRPQNRER